MVCLYWRIHPRRTGCLHDTLHGNINCCEFDLDGRKNNPGRTNPPVILAADHSMASRRFSACFQLYSLFNLVSPSVDRLSAIPLFPTRAKGPIFSPFDYDGLGKLVRRVMSWVFRCKETTAMWFAFLAQKITAQPETHLWTCVFV
jgi:hypothetical protein